MLLRFLFRVANGVVEGSFRVYRFCSSLLKAVDVRVHYRRFGGA